VITTIIQIIIVVIIFYFTIFKFAYRFPKHKDRLLDIFVIGFIIFLVPQFLDNTSQHYTALSIIGLAIVAYGYTLIIIYSFFEGYRSK